MEPLDRLRQPDAFKKHDRQYDRHAQCAHVYARMHAHIQFVMEWFYLGPVLGPSIASPAPAMRKATAQRSRDGVYIKGMEFT